MRAVRLTLLAPELLCFGAMAAVGVGVVLNLRFLRASTWLGLGDLAAPMVLKSALTGLAPPVAVAAISRKANLLFFAAMALGAAIYLGLAIMLRLMLPDALT